MLSILNVLSYECLDEGVRVGRRVWVRVRVRVGVVIKPITLSRYPLARKGLLFEIGRASCRERVSSPV